MSHAVEKRLADLLGEKLRSLKCDCGCAGVSPCNVGYNNLIEMVTAKGAKSGGPIAVVETADQWRMDMSSSCCEVIYDLGLIVIVPFCGDDGSAYTAFSQYRDCVILMLCGLRHARIERQQVKVKSAQAESQIFPMWADVGELSIERKDKDEEGERDPDFLMQGIEVSLSVSMC